jgi:hypothetical protein
MSGDLRAELTKLASVDLSVACDVTDSSEWKIRKEISRGELESFMDGRKRKITVRSIQARMERLLKAQASSPTIPPPPDRAKIAKTRAEALDEEEEEGALIQDIAPRQAQDTVSPAPPPDPQLQTRNRVAAPRPRRRRSISKSEPPKPAFKKPASGGGTAAHEASGRERCSAALPRKASQRPPVASPSGGVEGVTTPTGRRPPETAAPTGAAPAAVPSTDL